MVSEIILITRCSVNLQYAQEQSHVALLAYTTFVPSTLPGIYGIQSPFVNCIQRN